MQLCVWGLRGWRVTCASAKVQKKKEWQIDAQCKVQTGCLPGTRGYGFQLPGSHPCPTLANAGKKWGPGGPGIPGNQLQLRWTRLLVTSLPLLPLNQLVLSGSTFYL